MFSLFAALFSFNANVFSTAATASIVIRNHKKTNFFTKQHRFHINPIANAEHVAYIRQPKI